MNFHTDIILNTLNRNIKKIICSLLLLTALLQACKEDVAKTQGTSTTLPLTGTWRLLTGTTIDQGDTTITPYTQNISFIKIINESHFAFLLHDQNNGRDSTATFSSGGGTYTLADSVYTEHLEYCSDRNWEGHDFKFIINIHQDTLLQKGVEKIESEGIDRINIEKYIRWNKYQAASY